MAEGPGQYGQSEASGLVRPGGLDKPPRDGRSWLDHARSSPFLAYLVLVSLLTVAALQLEAAYDALNRENPAAASAKTHLQMVVLACSLTLAGCVLVWGLRSYWLLLAVLGGAWLLHGRYDESFSHWGMNWYGAKLFRPDLILGGLLAAALAPLAAWAAPPLFRRAWATQTIAFIAAGLAGAWLVAAARVLQAFQAKVAEADREWTTDHADPSLGWVAVAVVLLGAVAMLRRRRS